MQGDLDWVLSNGSYLVLFVGLLIAGIGVPLPEDVFMLAGGVLIHREVTSLVATVAVCYVGVTLGDLAIFLSARAIGPPALERWPMRGLLADGRRQRMERLFARHGRKIVFVARFLAGLRAPMFALAGLQRMSLSSFLFWDLLALSVSAPLLIALGYFFSSHVDLVAQHLASFAHYMLLGGVALLVGYSVFAVGRRFLRR